MGADSDTSDVFATVRDLVQSRRTNMLVDREREVPETIIRDLCELALWAPNHKRTWPWRFAAFSGDGRVRLGEACAQDLISAGSDDEIKINKVRSKYTRVPTVLVIGSAPDEHPTFHEEHRDAVAA
ncbi:MAG: nitroreductase family protein, partial [Ilumatobacteraceae bacterium]